MECHEHVIRLAEKQTQFDVDILHDVDVLRDHVLTLEIAVFVLCLYVMLLVSRR